MSADPPPVMVTIPFAGCVTDWMLFAAPPSGSVSLPSASIICIASSSVTVRVSPVAVGSVSMPETVMITVPKPEPPASE